MRECGNCSLCCTVMAVRELDKGANTSCVNDCGGSCGIYEQRPQSCRDFECLWLKGVVPQSVKPNECDVVLGATLDGNGMVAYVPSSRAHAHEHGDIKRLIDLVAKDRPVIISIGEKKIAVGDHVVA